MSRRISDLSRSILVMPKPLCNVIGFWPEKNNRNRAFVCIRSICSPNNSRMFRGRRNRFVIKRDKIAIDRLARNTSNVLAVIQIRILPRSGIGSVSCNKCVDRGNSSGFVLSRKNGTEVSCCLPRRASASINSHVYGNATRNISSSREKKRKISALCTVFTIPVEWSTALSSTRFTKSLSRFV